MIQGTILKGKKTKDLVPKLNSDNIAIKIGRAHV